MPMILPDMMSGAMPMSSRRGNVPSAELVCSVVKTWWPVIAARNAISAVSRSRISPTRMMSGSWRMIERMPLPKSIFAVSFTEVWRIIATGYSTGSSRVMMFTDSTLSLASIEYSVVVLPLPVGPVSTKMPSGLASIRLSFAMTDFGNPMCSRLIIDFSRSSTRRTMFSPQMVGCDETRKSTGRPLRLSESRPSCGARVSAIFMPLITLSRTAIPGQ